MKPTAQPSPARGTRFPIAMALAGSALAVASGAMACGAAAEDWEDPRLTGAGLEPPHATLVACPDADTASSVGPVSNAERVKSPWYVSLDGEWKLHYGRNHSERVPGFERPDFDDTGWKAIPVP